MTQLAPYIWHLDSCPAPAHVAECNCGYAAAKAMAEKADGHAYQLACVDHALCLALIPVVEERVHLDPCPAMKMASEIAAEVMKSLPALGAELQDLVALASLTSVLENGLSVSSGQGEEADKAEPEA